VGEALARMLIGALVAALAGGAPEVGHATPQARAVDDATVMAADNVTLVPLVADTVVPAVIPVPEITQPTQGGNVGIAVSVSAVDEPDVLPTPVEPRV